MLTGAGTDPGKGQQPSAGLPDSGGRTSEKARPHGVFGLHFPVEETLQRAVWLQMGDSGGFEMLLLGMKNIGRWEWVREQAWGPFPMLSKCCI